MAAVAGVQRNVPCSEVCGQMTKIVGLSAIKAFGIYAATVIPGPTYILGGGLPILTCLEASDHGTEAPDPLAFKKAVVGVTGTGVATIVLFHTVGVPAAMIAAGVGSVVTTLSLANRARRIIWNGIQQLGCPGA